jgi:hypothetical protein
MFFRRHQGGTQNGMKIVSVSYEELLGAQRKKNDETRDACLMKD